MARLPRSYRSSSRYGARGGRPPAQETWLATFPSRFSHGRTRPTCAPRPVIGRVTGRAHVDWLPGGPSGVERGCYIPPLGSDRRRDAAAASALFLVATA
eukprot:scaffold6198_cov408-Prasinococcus_capsulatus_cf.AAC.13